MRERERERAKRASEFNLDDEREREERERDAYIITTENKNLSFLATQQQASRKQASICPTQRQERNLQANARERLTCLDQWT